MVNLLEKGTQNILPIFKKTLDHGEIVELDQSKSIISSEMKLMVKVKKRSRLELFALDIWADDVHFDINRAACPSELPHSIWG